MRKTSHCTTFKDSTYLPYFIRTKIWRKRMLKMTKNRTMSHASQCRHHLTIRDIHTIFENLLSNSSSLNKNGGMQDSYRLPGINYYFQSETLKLVNDGRLVLVHAQPSLFFTFPVTYRQVKDTASRLVAAALNFPPLPPFGVKVSYEVRQ